MRHAVAAAAAAAFVLWIAAATAADDLLGWQDFRWGMTESEVVRAANASGLRLERRDESELGVRILDVPFEGAITVHDTRFTVRFMFSRDPRALGKISLVSGNLFSRSAAIPSFERHLALESVHAQILQTLTGKYGSPIMDQATGSPYFEPLSVWTFPTTTITLSGLPRVPVAMSIAITYQPTVTPAKKDEKEKL